MEPRIQYAKTKDGVSIAFSTLGKGEPLVEMPTIPVSFIEGALQIRAVRAWYDHLAQSRQVVCYDCRGSGLSERKVADCSIDSFVLDIEAVVGRLGLQTFSLFAPGGVAGQVAITFAVRNPERVSHLILWEAYASAHEALNRPQTRALFGLIDTDWETATEALAYGLHSWSNAEAARHLAALTRESISQERMKTVMSALSEWDVTELLPEVRSPTLVLHQRDYRMLDLDDVKALAAGIPQARLAILEGSGLWAFRNVETVLPVIDEFVGESAEGTAETPKLAAEDIHTILFTDVEGSKALTERLGDARARDLLREHERMVREALKSHGGSEFKTMGDGFMASFSSATKALECAIAVQRAFAERNESAEEPILVRVGLNAGEPIAEDEDLFGTAVNLAARITAQGKGGQILASEAVRQIVAGKKFLFSDLGETTLRGFEDPVHIYEVSWHEA